MSYNGQLTPVREKLLKLLSDGKWHRKFPGISAKTFIFMREFDFIRQRFFLAEKNSQIITMELMEARITPKGRFLLQHGHCNLRYEYNVDVGTIGKVDVIEMRRDR